MTTFLDLTNYGKLIVSDLSLNNSLSMKLDTKSKYNGPTGATGEKGETGIHGIDGITGPVGPTGFVSEDPWTYSATGYDPSESSENIFFNYDYNTGTAGTNSAGIGVDPSTYSSSSYYSFNHRPAFGVRGHNSNLRTDFVVNKNEARLMASTVNNSTVTINRYIRWGLARNPSLYLHKSSSIYAGWYNNHVTGNTYNYSWENNKLQFFMIDQHTGYLHRVGSGRLNFTGQHRTFIKNIPFNKAHLYQGLIVCSNNDTYINMVPGKDITLKTPIYGKDAISINESLPIVSLSYKEKDISIFGVISNIEEVSDKSYRIDEHGTFGTNYEKEYGDRRVHINSIGEGAIWVSNKNGNLLSGTYITSSSIPGYGQKQDDDRLANYTVAKITMSCDFNPPLQNKKRIKTRNVTFTERDNSGNYYDVSNNELIYTQVINYNPDIEVKNEYRNYKYDIIVDNSENLIEVKQNVLDSNDEIQWEDTDEQEYAYDIRYIDPSGNIITKEQHDSTISSGGMAYIAAFVGCTYHCG